MNMNVSLPDELANFVEKKVRSGHYSSSSEVVNDALRLLEKHDQIEQGKLDWLRSAYDVGIGSGPAAPLDMETVKKEGRDILKHSKI